MQQTDYRSLLLEAYQLLGEAADQSVRHADGTPTGHSLTSQTCELPMRCGTLSVVKLANCLRYPQSNPGGDSAAPTAKGTQGGCRPSNGSTSLVSASRQPSRAAVKLGDR